MKDFYILTVFICFGYSFFAQPLTSEFEFQLYFEDAVGNRDTITLGYSMSAIDTINPDFNEINILGQAIDANTLDIRISNNVMFTHPYPYPNWYQTKRKILPYNCDEDIISEFFTIEVFTNNWPVSVTCDNSDFSDVCRMGLMSSIDPGGWFDVGSISNLGIFYFESNQSTTFTPNFVIDNNTESSSNYFDDDGNRISRFWAAFVNDLSPFFGVGIENQEANNLKLYPNPFTNSFKIDKLPESAAIEIYDLQGREIQFNQYGNEIFIPNSHKGLFILHVKNNTSKYTKVLIKE